MIAVVVTQLHLVHLVRDWVPSLKLGYGPCNPAVSDRYDRCLAKAGKKQRISATEFVLISTEEVESSKCIGIME